MKKFFLILLVIFILLAVGVGIFLATFDAERYRPLLVRKMSEAAGRPVQLEKVSLRWNGGIAADLRGLTMEPAVRVERVMAVLKLLPFLRGSVQLGAVRVVRPQLHLIRGPAGAVDMKWMRSAKAASLFIGSVEIEEGTLFLTDSTMNPAVSVTARPFHLGLRNVSLAGPISLQAEAVLEVARAGQPAAEGKIRAAVERLQLSRAGPAGRLDLHLEQVRLIRINLLRELFSRLTMIPGLMEALRSRLPDSYRQKLEAEDTLLQPTDLQIHFSANQLTSGAFRLATDSFELTSAGGRVGFDGTVSLPAQFRVEKALSRAMTESVPELKFLADDQERLTLPVVLQGKLPQVAIVPDLGYLTQQFFSGKGQELIGSLLQKVLKQ